MLEPKSAMKPRAVKKRRRRWWELQEAAKEYVEGMKSQFHSLTVDVQQQILKLPNNFLCFHFRKTMQTEERHRFALAIAFARPKGALEYNMLEIDRLILRTAGRVRYAR